MRRLLKILALILVANIIQSVVAHADVTSETWTIGSKVFSNKAEAVRYIVSTGTQDEVVHTQCQILTNKLSFKACPKNKMASWDTQQFKSINATK